MKRRLLRNGGIVIVAKKKPAKKAPVKKVAKKAPAKKVAPKKAPAKKAAPKKAAKKAPAKKVAPKKAAPKKAAAVKVAKVEKAPVKKPLFVTPTKRVLNTPKNSNTHQYAQSELFDGLVSYCGFTSRKLAKEFFGSFSGLIQESLKSGYKLALPGLGKLQVRRTEARMGINPLTRETIRIPARKRIRFTPNKALKEAVL